MADASTTAARYPTLPGDADEQARRESARLRLRLLRGEWFDDLRRHMAQHFDPIREHAVGKPDTSTNLFSAVIDQLAVLYDRPPIIRHDDPAAAERATELLAGAGWWSLGGMLQRYALGCREAFVRPVVTEAGDLLLRVVTPDLVHAEESPDAPDLPAMMQEARMRELGEGDDQWYLDVLDVRDPANPSYRILRIGDGEDVTERVRGSTDWPQQFRLADGAPVMPYATYHAKRTGRLWDWRTGAESVEGTLTVAVLWSWWVHCTRDSAWSQRWTMDAALRGSKRSGTGTAEHSAIVTDPSSVMQFQSDGDRATIGQWVPAIDPLTLGTAIGEFEQRLLVHFGLSPGDVQRAEGASSGYAITLRRESVRQAQRRMASQFERGDVELLRLISCLYRGTDKAIPEDGWSVSYPGPPKSWDEVQAEMNRLGELAALGLASKVDAYMELHPGTTREQATEELRRILDEDRMLGALRPVQPGPMAR